MINTQWTTCGRKLLKDGHSFFVRGVNYAPTPIGKPGRLDMLGEPSIFLRDLQNLRAMHANAVKTYDFYSSVDHSKYLDAAYNGGVDPIFTVFSIWIDQSLMDPRTRISSDEFQAMITNYREMAELTGGHPGVMGYSIGGEMNSITVVHDQSFWDKFAALTQAVHQGLATHGNAHKIITTTFVDDGGASFRAGEKFGADVDMWGSNVYQRDYPGSVIPTYMRVPSTKPLLVSEYGYPYASNIEEGRLEELEMVGKLLLNQAVQMEENYNMTDELREQILVGGFVFEYSDEWWKSGDVGKHNLGQVRNIGFPLGYLAEEYFGLYKAVKAEEDETNILHPRPTVDLLTNLWAKGKIGGEGMAFTDCSVKSLPFQQMHATPLVSTSSAWLEPILFVIVFCAFVFVAFSLYLTNSRRAHYRRLSPLFKSPRLKSAKRMDDEESFV
ncbi:TPA: hypothetical protein N0F65_007879 [Lagenidium giganteum]|uniref:Uncharacterized protein n=1 Tax=Lagenidium giganteum TaxID=4803 RepID=A0AAV2Z3M8_9STRA|nr:TPA: hypothetical protein N0F65_007879 [Lagenidium giganteum]